MQIDINPNKICTIIRG